ncbi:MAG: hypothetical protein KME28_22620 [Pelatocladus maniniholoensis HA4357-MV3]|uniref:Uncharacterized protein n=1 Tax=Pelatocladus maniniholoensis HA4357-MV3 TaxID=1117104 RepID=A0A9E3HBX6_9NOST|nr:hypothetical protein [Pelatocladus maniniholoensis HA4357-MV3]
MNYISKLLLAIALWEKVCDLLKLGIVPNNGNFVTVRVWNVGCKVEQNIYKNNLLDI